MSDLLPCPFCGSVPVFSLDKKTHCQLHGDPSQSVRLSCNRASCFVRPTVAAGDTYNGGEAKAREEVAERWNTRADLPATDAQALANPKVQALVEALNDAIGDATWGIDHETYKKGRAAIAELEVKG